MKFGVTGKILRVDLTGRKHRVEEPDDTFYRTYFGGSALACHYLLKERGRIENPLGPENLLVFASSPLVGSGIPGANRYSVAAISPLTGVYGEGEAGGWWSPELKRAGFDAVLVEGRAERPVYLWIRDGEVEIRDAAALWGTGTGETQKIIEAQTGASNVRVAAIGPAGENQVRFACVVNALKHTNGRGGMGAVMGSKNLRAIAAKGSQRLEVHDPEKMKELAKLQSELIASWGPSKVMRNLGTPNLIMPLNTSGILPTRNFHSGSFEGAENLSGEKMRETILKTEEGCYACAVRCKRAVEVTSGPYTTSPEYGGPEYETLGSLGSLLCVGDLTAVSKGNELCNRYGLDTISVGVAIALAMECYENGILTKADTGGLDFRFGNADAMIQAIHWIAKREKGLGDLLAEGVKRAAKKIGKGSEKFAMEIKGQELPMHDPRGKTGQGLSFALSPTGADHVEAPLVLCLGADPPVQPWDGLSVMVEDIGPGRDDNVQRPADPLEIRDQDLHGNRRVHQSRLTDRLGEDGPPAQGDAQRLHPAPSRQTTSTTCS